MNQGALFVFSAPSGAGKTTLLKRLLAALPNLEFSVSHTTRPARPGEQDGKDYHFIDREAFLALRDQGAFLEWAEVHGNFYGTSREAVTAALARGRDLVLDIDVQGAAQVRRAADPATVFIFIAPPSPEVLAARLRGRNTDTPEMIARRLENARREMAEAGWYDYRIVNDQLEKAEAELREIIEKVRAGGGPRRQ